MQKENIELTKMSVHSKKIEENNVEVLFIQLYIKNKDKICP